MKRKITELKPLPEGRNPNAGNPKGLNLLEKSISTNGAFDGMTIAANGDILSGNKRAETFGALGLDEVEVIETDGSVPVVVKRTDIPSADDPRGKAIILAANQVHAESYTPIPAIELAYLDELKLENYDIGAAGYTEADYGELLKELGMNDDPADAEPQIDRAAELQAKWQTERGQLWRIGEHRLLCGDSTRREDVERVMGGEKAGACVTDPPYGVNIDYAEYKDSEENWYELMNAVIPLMREFSEMCAFPCGQIARLGWWYEKHKPDWLIIWYKGSPGHRSAIGFNDYEPLIVYGRGKGVTMHDYFDVRPKEKMGEFGHPCPKPPEWSMWLIERMTTERGAIIFEPFAGSGTTLVACQNLSRKCRAIEISPAYCAVILERMATAFPGIVIEQVQ